MAVTYRTGDRLERLALEIEWLQQRLISEGFEKAASSLNDAKRAADWAGQEVKREIDRRSAKAAA
jgi:hypothetical protein